MSGISLSPEYLGNIWDKDNTESVMALARIYHSGLWHSYWMVQRTAA